MYFVIFTKIRIPKMSYHLSSHKVLMIKAASTNRHSVETTAFDLMSVIHSSVRVFICVRVCVQVHDISLNKRK